MADLDRRGFMLRSAVLTGGVLLGAGSALAQEAQKGFTPYVKVDESLFQGINRAGDDIDSTLVKKHVPVIDVPKQLKIGEAFPVTITVGETIHPMNQAHYIHDVELYAGNEPVGRMTLSPTFSHPKAVFWLTLDRPVTLVAREYCNLHGSWENRKEIQFS